MTKNSNAHNPSKRPAGLNRLADDLAAISARSGLTAADEDMLSLLVDGALKGEDISQRYPALYGKLLQNADLREAFIDLLTSIETERAGELAPLSHPLKVELGFLGDLPHEPAAELLGNGTWRATWERTIQQLQALISSRQLIYRSAGASLTEDPWFTLLRGEVQIEGLTYAVVLECTLADEDKEVLAAFVMLAVTQTSESGLLPFPVQASLHWDTYEASIRITEEGRARFPDIPLEVLLKTENQKVDTGLRLTLQNLP